MQQQILVIVTIPVVLGSSGFGVVTVDVSVTDDVVGASLAVVGVTSVDFVTDVVSVDSEAVEVVTDGASEAVADGAVDVVTDGASEAVTDGAVDVVTNGASEAVTVGARLICFCLPLGVFTTMHTLNISTQNNISLP